MVDSDDWLSDDALQLSAEVLDTEQGVDCVLFDFIIAERDDVRVHIRANGGITRCRLIV